MFFLLWAIGVPFAGVIGGILLLFYSILIFVNPDKFAYRTFLFQGEDFDHVFRRVQKCFAFVWGLFAIIVILFPPFKIPMGVIGSLGVAFGAAGAWSALQWLYEVRILKSRQKQVNITITQKITIWFILGSSITFILAGIMILWMHITLE